MVEALDAIVQVAIVGIWLSAVVGLVRRPDWGTFDLAALFTGFVAYLLLDEEGSVSIPAEWSLVLFAAILAGPVFFVRLASRFQRLRTPIEPIAWALYGLGLLGILLSNVIGPVWLGVPIFLLGFGYVAAGLLFFFGARKLAGIAQVRMHWGFYAALFLAATASVSMAAASAGPHIERLSVGRITAQEASVGLGELAQLGALAFAITSVIAFAPPRRLQSIWRDRELHRLVSEFSQLGPDASPAEVVAVATEAARRTVTGCYHGVLDESAPQAQLSRAFRLAASEIDSDPAAVHVLAAPVATQLARCLGQAGTWSLGYVVELRDVAGPRLVLVVGLDRPPAWLAADQAGLGVLATQCRMRLVQAGLVQGLGMELSQARALERFKSEFLGTLAHELGNPTTPLLLQLAALDRPGGPDPERLQAALPVLKRSAQRLEHLIQDMKDVAALSRPDASVHVADVDIVRLAQASIAYAQSVAEADHEFKVEAPETLAMRADPHRLSQILDNLLSNAVKYSPGGGKVHVRVRRVRDRVEVEVNDHGLGLTRVQLEALFHQHARLHKADHPKIPGTGLGLYISQTIARLHGGKLTAESEGPGQGSTFRLVLPANGPTPPTDSRAP